MTGPSFILSCGFAALVVLLIAAALWARVRQRLIRRQLLARQRDLSTLQALSWQDFERLTGEAFRKMGYRVQETGLGGADDGVDLVLTRGGRRYVVHCKHWKRGRVGAPVVREMVGVALHAKAQGVIVVTCGQFTAQAWRYAKGKPIRLIDGVALLRIITAGTSNFSLPSHNKNVI